MFANIYGQEISIEEISEKVIIYGASTRNKKLIEELKGKKKILFCVDSNDEKWGGVLYGLDIYSPQHMNKVKEASVISCLLGNAESVQESVHKYGKFETFFYSRNEFENIDNCNFVEDTYKYIHIFPESPFVCVFYDMIEKFMDIKEHLFCVDLVVSEQKEVRREILEFFKKKSVSNVMYINDYLNNYYVNNSIREFKKIDFENAKVYLHSAFWGKCLRNALKSIMDKDESYSSWICWGADGLKDKMDSESVDIVKKINTHYASNARIKEVSDLYGVKVCETCAQYAYIPNESLSNECANIENMRILLGHSATFEDMHADGFEVLSKYKDNDIEIYAPMSYGSIEYRDEVITKGKEIFGEKFIPLLNFMHTSEYFKFLKTIDIAVFPMKRGMAGTTLKYLSVLRKPVFGHISKLKDFYEMFSIEYKEIDKLNQLSYDKLYNKYHCKSKDIDSELEMYNYNIFKEWEKILLCK